MIKVSTLKLREDNPRMITEAAIDKLGESISRDPEYMVIRPIVIDEDRVVLGGNQRLRAIIKLGMKTVPDTWVVEVKDWPEEKRKRFILVDNSPEGMSGYWNYDLLQAKWDSIELEEVGFNLGENDPEKEWDGMPECNNENLLNVPQIIIRFETVEDKIAFGKIIGQKITKETKSTWYPKKEWDSLGTKEGLVYE